MSFYNFRWKDIFFTFYTRHKKVLEDKGKNAEVWAYSPSRLENENLKINFNKLSNHIKRLEDLNKISKDFFMQV